MKRFAQLYCELDQTTRTNDKVEAMVRYFKDAPPEDAAWGLHFLSGRKTPRIANSRLLVQWLCEEASLPAWLFDESYDAVGDLGETLALLLPSEGKGSSVPLHQMVDGRIMENLKMPEEWRREILVKTWRELNCRERLVWNKIITGNFRVGVAKTLVIRALANFAGVEPAIMSHRVMGRWETTGEDYQRLLNKEDGETDPARPYPFFLASQLEERAGEGVDLQGILGEPSDWQVEWKWDGIRAQLICRNGKVFLWSRGDENGHRDFS